MQLLVAIIVGVTSFVFAFFYAVRFLLFLLFLGVVDLRRVRVVCTFLRSVLDSV